MAWNHNFFHGLPQQAWKAAQTEEQTQLDLELLVETLEFGPGERLLDIFCGYGRHTLPLARMGTHVTAVDISDEYIDELQKAAARENLAVNAVAADFLSVSLSELTLDKPVDAAY